MSELRPEGNPSRRGGGWKPVVALVLALVGLLLFGLIVLGSVLDVLPAAVAGILHLAVITPLEVAALVLGILVLVDRKRRGGTVLAVIAIVLGGIFLLIAGGGIGFSAA